MREPSGLIVGAVGWYCSPLNFVPTLRRTATLHRSRFAMRGGMDNITNQANPTKANNVSGAPQLLGFQGGEGRHFVVRIRFFDRADNQQGSP